MRFFTLLLAAFVALSPTPGNATPCQGAFINPLTALSWRCVFPIQIGGVKIYDKRDPDLDRDNPSSPVCLCPSKIFPFPTPGLRVNFWNPSRWIDTTEEPGCLRAIGVDVMSTSGRLHGADTDDGRVARRTFAQSHYYIAPAWALLDLFTDLPCLSSEGFDVAMMSELNPLYQNAALGLLAYPETILFANPAAQLACIADAAEANHSKSTNDTLFWCMGAWGPTYPMGGNSGASSQVVANAHIAAKQIYMMGRLGLLKNSARSGCGEIPAPIWKKSMYKMQAMKPVKQAGCVNIGQSGLLWASGKMKPTDTNFTWSVFEKIYCCVNP